MREYIFEYEERYVDIGRALLLIVMDVLEKEQIANPDSGVVTTDGE